MPLTMRPTGLGAGIDKDRPDYTIYSGGWAVGRIYETRGGHARWFWSLTVDPPMARSDKVATLEEAKAQFETAWRQWLACGEAAGNAVAPCVPLLIIDLAFEAQGRPYRINALVPCLVVSRRPVANRAAWIAEWDPRSPDAQRKNFYSTSSN